MKTKSDADAIWEISHKIGEATRAAQDCHELANFKQASVFASIIQRLEKIDCDIGNLAEELNAETHKAECR
jgi:hypothetical protein